jgi:integrase
MATPLDRFAAPALAAHPTTATASGELTEWRPAAAELPPAGWAPVALSPELATLRAEASAEPARFFELAHRSFFRALQAQSPNTQRAYAADWKSFVRFCDAHGYPALPAPPAALESFIEASCVYSAEVPYKYLAEDAPRRGLKSSSVRRAVAAIGAVHVWLQYANPVAHPDVAHTLTINTRGRSAKTPKAPLAWAAIEQALGTYGEALNELRTKALVTVAFSTLLRRSELVALEVADFQPTPDADDGLLRVGKSKADQAGAGDVRYVTPAARAHLERWLAAAQLSAGPIFVRFDRTGAPLPKALHPNEVARTFKDVARRAGLNESEVARIAGHSTRIGATHELGRHGTSLPQLMRAGGWASPQMPAVYLREAEVQGGAMAQWARTRRARPDPAG